MKATFIGLYEIEKFGIKDLVELLKFYGFDTVYLEYEVFFFFSEFKDFKKVLWVHCLDSCVRVVRDVLSCFTFDGVLLDGIRCMDEDFGVKGILKSISIAYLVKEYGEMVNEFGTELEVCFKCEDYVSVFSSEVNRLFWGVSIWMIKSCVSKILLMTYHDEYNVSIDRVSDIVRGLRVFHKTNKIVPIWQTYKDNPKVDYNILWSDVKKESKNFKDKVFFRFGTCDLETFK